MIEYRTIREQALIFNGRMPDGYPCRRCDTGDCCRKTTINLTFDDAIFIVQAIKSGFISSGIMRKAARNAGNPARDYCPFYDTENRLCDIYNFRPVPCIAYGQGGLSNEDTIRSMLNTPALEKQVGIAARDAQPLFICLKGYEELIGKGEVISVRDIVAAVGFRKYVEGMRAQERVISVRQLVARLDQV